ncbi:MAG: HPr family phosphocarrier protein [Lachnospiraceae bacterium]|nr:HPr family phosphocarrier protein [Lachnospiraceae bacterium]MDE6698115.1 HPr family phosphocarrier protein [Lachnospiraceae bacterium]
MVSKRIVIKDETGLHLRPAGQLCKMASQYNSHITFKTKNSEANAKSVLSILGACVKKNDEIELICQGEDEVEALEAISNALSNGFLEE